MDLMLMMAIGVVAMLAGFVGCFLPLGIILGPVLGTIAGEQLAKIAALIDVVIRRQPKFLGPLEKVPE